MYSTNFVEVEGNVGRDAEVRATAKSPVATFSVAVWIAKDKTLWLDVSFFDDKAGEITGDIRKGDKVLVRGRLDFWLDKEGKERVQIIATHVYKLTKPNIAGRNDVRAATPKPESRPVRAQLDDADIPF